MARAPSEEPQGVVYQPGEPVPDWLLPVRAPAAELAGHCPDELVEILVRRYPEGSTIGWRSDAPAFGTVVGVSLGGFGYVSSGDARRSWEHSIPPTKELRYSITFRTLRDGKAP